MPRETINPPLYNSQEFNTGDAPERGDQPKVVVDKLNTMLTELYAADTATAGAITDGASLKSIDVTLTAAQVNALFTTPVSVLAAPAAGYANVIDGIIAYKAAGTAYASVDGTEEIAFSYTNAAGLKVAQIEPTGFLDQTTAQTRYASSYRAASGDSSITPVAAAAIVAHMLVGNVTTGTSDLKLRIIYRTIPTVLA